MRTETRWRAVGVLGMALGVWMFVWGIAHVSLPLAQAGDSKLDSQQRVRYLRIWSFDVDDDQAFIDAAMASISRLPDRGLILDLRDNPGGFIWAAERLLQLFTLALITPTKFALRATPMTAAMARAAFNQAELAPWAESLFTAEQTGTLLKPSVHHLSRAVQRSRPALWRSRGGRGGREHLFVRGSLYGRYCRQSHRARAVRRPGNRGANVWDSDDLCVVLNAADQPLPRLPKGVAFTVAVRRAVRTGEAEGTLIEDAGVPGQVNDMTRRDIFQRNRDLIKRCGELLAAQPLTRLKVRRQRNAAIVETTGIDRLDL